MKTPHQNKDNPSPLARVCAECNLVSHKKCIPKEYRPDHFPSHDWVCHLCTKTRKTPKGLIPMNITSARDASKRFHTNAANAHKEENKKRLQNLTNLQAMCPTTEIKEITSSSDTIRTVEKQKHFNGPWLLEDPPENIAPATITVWMLTKGTPKPHGPSKTDQTGMLDTARQTLWADMQASAPQPDKEPEAELFRRAKAWNTHANPPKMDNATQETTTTITPQPPTSKPPTTQKM